MSKGKKKPAAVFLLVAGCLLLAAAGCGVRDLASGRLSPPEVRLRELAIFPPESNCWPLSARLAVANPNTEPLQIRGYDFIFQAAGHDLVQGESSSAVTVPAGGTAEVEMPLLIRLPSVPPVLQALLRQEAIPYQLTGGLRLASVLGGLRLPFRFQGTLTRAQGLEYLRQYLGSQSLTR